MFRICFHTINAKIVPMKSILANWLWRTGKKQNKKNKIHVHISPCNQRSLSRTRLDISEVLHCKYLPNIFNRIYWFSFVSVQLKHTKRINNFQLCAFYDSMFLKDTPNWSLLPTRTQTHIQAHTHRQTPMSCWSSMAVTWALNVSFERNFPHFYGVSWCSTIYYLKNIL